MSIVVPARGNSGASLASCTRNLFISPQPAGRRITTGFSYLQRIGKSGAFDVWFPEELKRELDERKTRGETIGSKHFASQWAAVRQFELLHESGNHKIYDLDPERLERAMLDLSRSMRAGGYRMTVATLGRYEETSRGDDLEILDRRLQEGIAQMIHMLYLDEASNQANSENDARLALSKWDYRRDLPHIGVMLGARDLFQRRIADDDDENRDIPRRGKSGGKKGGSGAVSLSARRNNLARQFFDILNKLPQNHLVHDTAVGLQLPELNGENQWNYIADPEETFGAFNRVLGNLFDKFNGISLSRLHGRENAQNETKASTLHMRGYGDRLNERGDRFYRAASLALN